MEQVRSALRSRDQAQARFQTTRLPQWRWHLDEVFVKINGKTHYLWRAVDHEGEVLESFVTRTQDRKAALKFLRKLGHVDRWRTQSRMDVMSMKPRKLAAVLS